MINGATCSMNKLEKQVLKDILSSEQERLGSSEDRDESMKKYDVVDSIIKKLRLYH